MVLPRKLCNRRSVLWARGTVALWRRGCSSAERDRWFRLPPTPSEEHDDLIWKLNNPTLVGDIGGGRYLQDQQIRLVGDLGGRYFHAVMAYFSRYFNRYIPEISLSEGAMDISDPAWYETRPYLAKLEAFLHYNKMRPQPIFPAGDLEALVAAYMAQEPSKYEREVQGSMLSMALSVHSMHDGSWPTPDTYPIYPVKGITFVEHDPWWLMKKRFVALFRILFKREVDDVVAQQQRGCVDPECTILMQRNGIRGLPPLLKLYVEQSFGRTTKVREEASKGLKLLLNLHTEGALQTAG